MSGDWGLKRRRMGLMVLNFRENYQGRLTFHIPMTGMKWSAMFGILEKNRNRLHIENYSLSQATLEEVFLSFTKYQKEHG